jgi:hypothetical protein
MRSLTCYRRLPGGLAVVALVLVNSSQLHAQSVTAIEEDWQLDINTSNAVRSSPQFDCLTSTGADIQSLYAILVVNQHGATGGNLQLQLWNGDQLLAITDVPNSSAILNTTGERINWTTRLSLSKSVLTAEILNLSSTTWGNSTGKNTIATVSAATSLAGLDSYDPNVTCQNSGVEIGNTRVQKLTLRKTRIYTGKQKSVETSLERVVYQNN